ncbi:ATP-binding protein [Kitasatospora sp. NPDC056076]|uniref:ATP-binding protein n=1 Tax=Streptomycetaceae TaxID=2062 RepID=UPI0035D8AC4A
MTGVPAFGGEPATHQACALPLPETVGGAAEGRVFTAAVLAGLPDPVRQDAVLLVSELISNAYRYADGPRRLRLVTSSRLIRAEVSDGSPWPPVPSQPAADQVGGFGVFLVDRLAARWGWRRQGAGKAVWFELVLPAS